MTRTRNQVLQELDKDFKERTERFEKERLSLMEQTKELRQELEKVTCSLDVGPLACPLVWALCVSFGVGPLACPLVWAPLRVLWCGPPCVSIGVGPLACPLVWALRVSFGVGPCISFGVGPLACPLVLAP